MNSGDFRSDCDNWNGYKPCKIQKSENLRNCSTCTQYFQAERKSYTPLNTFDGYEPGIISSVQSIGIIEMGGLGSHVRISALVKEIRKVNPNAELLWYTRPVAFDLVKMMPGVIPVEAVSHQISQIPELIINFELSDFSKELVPKARYVAGLRVNEFGKFEPSSSHAFSFQRLQIDDVFRKNENSSTMTEILFQTLGLNGENFSYALQVSPESQQYADSILTSIWGEIPRNLIGLNLGTSQKGELKRWPARHFSELAIKLAVEGNKVCILSGPEDVEVRKIVESELESSALNIRFIPDSLTIPNFVAVLNRMRTLVTADTFAFHAAFSQNIPTILLTGPMPHQEMEIRQTNQRGVLLTQNLDCSPCYYKCIHSIRGACMSGITVDEVFLKATSQFGES